MQAQDERVLQLQTRLQTLMDQLGEMAGPDGLVDVAAVAQPSAAAIEALSLDLSLNEVSDVSAAGETA